MANIKPPKLEDVSVEAISKFDTAYKKYESDVKSANVGKIGLAATTLMTERDCCSASLLATVEEVFEVEHWDYDTWMPV